MSGVSILAYNRASNNPYTDNRIVNRIFWAVGGAVALIALGSFTLSFTALFDLAVKNSVPAHLGWIWPLIVDLSMVIYTAAILVAQLQRRGAKLPVALTIFYAAVTITGTGLVCGRPAAPITHSGQRDFAHDGASPHLAANCCDQPDDFEGSN